MPDEEVKVVKKIEKAQEKGLDLGLDKKEVKEVKEVKEDERKLEVEKPVEKEKPQEVAETPAVSVTPEPPSQIPIKKEEILVDLEQILADDLTDIFLELPDARKLEFKQRGEEVAQKIREMVSTGKFKIGKALNWIREWLQMIPGVNKYFIDQEAKIKADKIVQYTKDYKKRLSDKV
ncbi:hypothetical protein HN358_03565 [Candidatus Uhrbacteria bacterium]|jgi:hypothetical protein|nr:hypothetical protein [Candidatus Uhrbacteria bacterium]MBT7717214.1 hypothetical protein [Candidatus Uhrbacteria bacterium]